jgi:hypothetical protein
MAKDNEVFRHWRIGIWRLQPIAQLNSFGESRLGEMDMINVGAFASAGDLVSCSGLWCALSLNKHHRQKGKQCDGENTCQ